MPRFGRIKAWDIPYTTAADQWTGFRQKHLAMIIGNWEYVDKPYAWDFTYNFL
jgi:hypothetical protein